jgi:hypothetical protein
MVLLLALCEVQSGETNQDPESLVAALGSTRYAQRETAAAALERIGRPALAALRAAREARDPEVRARATSLIQKIESAMLTRPTRLKLEFQNAPLPEVTKSLSLQSGFRVELYPAHVAKWRDQRLSISESEPLDFWKAIDRVCDLAGLQYNSRMQGTNGQNEMSVFLTDGQNRTLTPISDHGPFRVSLLSVDYQRRLTYGPGGVKSVGPPPAPRPAERAPGPRDLAEPPRLNPTTTVTFTAQLQVAAEPRLNLSQVRRIELVEATDELGHSLIPAADGDQTQNRYGGYFGAGTGAALQIMAHLERPDPLARTIKRLDGIIPMTVSSRRPGPVIVPLNNAVGKTFENDDYALTVHDFRPTPTNHNLMIELSLSLRDPDSGADRLSPDLVDDGFQRADPRHLQIEVYGVDGRLIPWFQSGFEAESSRFTLTLTNQSQPSRVKELRYYGLTRASVKIPFHFADIPMP